MTWSDEPPPDEGDPCEHCGTRQADETILDHRDKPMRLCGECTDLWDRQQLEDAEQEAAERAPWPGMEDGNA